MVLVQWCMITFCLLGIYILQIILYWWWIPLACFSSKNFLVDLKGCLTAVVCFQRILSTCFYRQCIAGTVLSWLFFQCQWTKLYFKWGLSRGDRLLSWYKAVIVRSFDLFLTNVVLELLGFAFPGITKTFVVPRDVDRDSVASYLRCWIHFCARRRRLSGWLRTIPAFGSSGEFRGV